MKNIILSLLIILVIPNIGLNQENHQIVKLPMEGSSATFSDDGSKVLYKNSASSKVHQYNGLTLSLFQGLKSNEVQVHSSSDLRSILIREGEKTRLISPLGDEDYINVSLSPDQTQLTFRVSGLASYVTDLEGNIQQKIEDAQFPLWLDNTHIIYARVEDDGYQYLSSQLLARDLVSGEDIKITIPENLIPLFPSIHPSGSHLLFTTPESEIYLLEIEDRR